jgi:hypothetical protein
VKRTPETNQMYRENVALLTGPSVAWAA